MMPDRRMFWRVVRQLVWANRGRTFVILVALGAGAAVTAALLNLQVDAQRRLTTELVLKNGKNEETCQARVSPSTGGPEDDQIAVPLKHAQDLAALPGRASLIEITAPGSAKEITDYISSLQRIAAVSVRPIRQFT